ncbi:hypothetical protein QW060_27510 [Myroides ceti]|uniref:Uncharacterized protein n=1 Tax=Paenimyroides ceti TaxID=395087 RepID=A0ABT8D3M8_9FLAO|nr:hypothetical protein [Paenimyroides ceti]MDN3710541.1 hypothetical protein [Paenimyroides ceti]
MNHKIAAFSFLNQNNKMITEKEYEGKIYVAEFFLLPVRPFVQL